MEKKKSLYRIYRPSNFDELAGHENIKEILINEVNNNTFPNALLFSGQRGTGKTSLAKIFAKVINCTNLQGYNPCDQCESCKLANSNSHPDIFEIDAASNNGVDEIRNIKNNVSTLPIMAKYKVYIIDEVHMLTNSAFNALLKTLEEPPKHIVFILATTEYAKIPATIVSRCQTFNFKKISKEALENKIEEVSVKEGSKITKGSLDEIYYMSDGSLRDAFNYLEQVMTISGETITEEDLKKTFYIATKKEKIKILANALNNNNSFLIDYFENANKKGLDFESLALGLIDITKEIIEVKMSNNKKFLNLLDEMEYNIFNTIELEKFFDLADHLAEAYGKSKNSSINFQYLLISLLKSAGKNTTHISVKHTEKPSDNEVIENKEPVVEVKEEPLIKEELVEEPVIKEEPVVEAVEEVISPIVEEQQVEKDTHEKRENIEIGNENLGEKNETVSVINETEAHTAEEIQMKSMISQKANDLKEIHFEDDDIINIVVGANKEARKYFGDKFDELFILNEQGELLHKDAEKFIMFLNAKVSAAYDYGMIVLCEDIILSRWINNSLQDMKFREELFKFLDRAVSIVAVDKTRWQSIRHVFENQKNNGVLKPFADIEPEEFYEHITLLNTENESDSEYVKRAKTLFGDDNVKVVS